jgi:hypothetical protein
MKETLGDKLFWIATIVFCSVFVLGWILLIGIILLQWLFPVWAEKLDKLLKMIAKPLGLIQRYSIIAAVTLFLCRLVAGWLGWATPLSSSGEE